VEILFCAGNVQDGHAGRHRRASLKSPSPDSLEVEIGPSRSTSSPAKAFVKVNNKESNDWKAWFNNRADTQPVVTYEVDVVSPSKRATGFAFGLAPLSVAKDKATADKPLRWAPCLPKAWVCNGF